MSAMPTGARIHATPEELAAIRYDAAG
ncbi:MAG: hypothetical protein QOE00_664, partial [Ilumatobacteraceae bacterium]